MDPQASESSSPQEAVLEPDDRATDEDDTDISAVLPQDDKHRNELSEEERQWAWDIKETIEGIPEMDNLSDYMYVQLALIEKDDIEKAVERAYKLQVFREEYGVLDTREDGRRHLKNFIQLMPKHILSFTFHATEGYMFVGDFKGFESDALRNPRDANSYFCASYYLFNCFSPDFTAVREGIIGLYECQGWGQARNVDVKVFQRFYNDLASAYPIRTKALKHFHTGVFVNLLYSMAKKFIPSDIRKVVEVGCEVDGYLDEIYLTPSVEAANQRVFGQLVAALEKRYENERSFRLPPPGERSD